MANERTPLLHGSYDDEDENDPHHQFCNLIGVIPSNLPPGAKPPSPRPTSLYQRATRDRRRQNFQYIFTATLSNSLLLIQVVLGAALTALGASESSHVLITIFGVFNTVIAGLVAYLKSRGQPMRARMYLDDLERVVDEIENSEIMWLGISKGVHGYDEIDPTQVTVRSEVARLTRLYDRAVRTNTMNNPDMYMAGAISDPTSGLKARTLPSQPPIPVPVIPSGPDVPIPAPAVPDTTTTTAAAASSQPAAPAATDPDQSPATAPTPKDKDKDKEEADKKCKDEQKSITASTPASATAPAPTSASAPDPDESPATAAKPPGVKNEVKDKAMEKNGEAKDAGSDTNKPLKSSDNPNGA